MYGSLWSGQRVYVVCTRSVWHMGGGVLGCGAVWLVCLVQLACECVAYRACDVGGLCDGSAVCAVRMVYDRVDVWCGVWPSGPALSLQIEEFNRGVRAGDGCCLCVNSWCAAV